MDGWRVDQPSVHLWLYELEAHETVHFYYIITSLEIITGHLLEEGLYSSGALYSYNPI